MLRIESPAAAADRRNLVAEDLRLLLGGRGEV
jgi:hypothetical protein